MSARKFIQDSFGIAFAQYVVRATLMLRTLLAARLLGPVPLGAWNAIQLVLDNGALLMFGTQQGLDQLVPPRVVAGDAEGERRIKRAALFNIAVLSAALRPVLLRVDLGRPEQDPRRVGLHGHGGRAHLRGRDQRLQLPDLGPALARGPRHRGPLDADPGRRRRAARAGAGAVPRPLGPARRLGRGLRRRVRLHHRALAPARAALARAGGRGARPHPGGVPASTSTSRRR